MLPELERFIDNAIVTKRPVPISTLREKDVHNYPYKALRELMMNSCMHRDYQSNMPTRLYQYDSHIEVMNPGGLYGQARPENFPHVNDYRNSVVAEMMKTLNYVNMFNHGINEVQDLLKANGNPEAEFNVSYLTAFSVVVNKPDETSLPKFAQVDGGVNINDNEIIISKLFQELFQACPSIAQVSPKQIFAVLDCCNEGKSLAELMEALSASSRRTFVRRIMLPFMEDNLVKQTHPDNPRHPHQKYILTEKGKEWLDKLSEQ